MKGLREAASGKGGLDYGDLWAYCDEAADEIDRLEAELAEARREIRSLSVFATETLKNDERYQWLRNNYASVGFDGRELIWDELDPSGLLDAAIDAARSDK